MRLFNSPSPEKAMGAGSGDLLISPFCAGFCACRTAQQSEGHTRATRWSQRNIANAVVGDKGPSLEFRTGLDAYSFELFGGIHVPVVKT